MAFICMNGSWMAREEAQISPADRGLRYGDGAFETIRVRQGRPYQWPLHLARLQEGLAALAIAFDTRPLTGWLEELVRRHAPDGIARIMVTRGEGGEGYLPPEDPAPLAVLEFLPLRPRPQNPVLLWRSGIEKISAGALPVACKLMGNLNSVFARQEAAKEGCFESLMLNAEGSIAEASSANIFWFAKGTLYTPSLDCGILKGTIREAVMRLSAWPVTEGAFEPEALKGAEEVFLTNVSWGCLPVSELKPQGWRFGDRGIAAELNRRIERDHVG